ncbi:MAG: DUF6242 domain-containing protein [Bacteroidales bacterium]|nr:DUF6242 domain-containing protein [Bacteroidales bacterium]MDD3430430.1 DUF6242 domain-containing protein [Bacteroidales bacterium]MDD4361091.1 DUF6242 domain-containing protein [Bacteroidales bacterium]MDD4430112.1 DUF6242 domain-containing protein [Bacteroidales bacterium]
MDKIIYSIKNKVRLLVLLSPILLGIPSCHNFEDQSLSLANVQHFGFDSFPEIADYTFYIDNFAGLIYNTDSLPYQTRVDSLFPSIIFFSSNGNVLINDTLLWKVGDVLDFSRPLSLTNNSEDGKHQKKYQLRVNVHQINPDSMVMNVLSSQFPTISARNKTILYNGLFKAFFAPDSGSIISYTSTDQGISWSADAPVSGLNDTIMIQSLTEFKEHYYLLGKQGNLYYSTDLNQWSVSADSTKVLSLFGKLEGRKFLSEDALVGIIADNNGDLRFARFTGDSAGWESGTVIPENFPLREYAHTQYKTVTKVPYISLLGGINANGTLNADSWSTMDGLYWIKVNTKPLLIEPRQGASLFHYDDKMFYYGGLNNQGFGDSTLFVSENHGITWSAADTILQFYSINERLAYQHIFVEEDKYIWIFGGESGNISNKVWKGNIHRKLFPEK